MPKTYLHREPPVARIAKRQEERHARAVGGRRQPGSGNQPMARGDVRHEGWLGELKFTATGVYRLSTKALRKIEREALAIGVRPYLAVEFRCNGIMNPGEMWVIVPRYVMEDLFAIPPPVVE